jgi:hypothetical protein
LIISLLKSWAKISQKQETNNTYDIDIIYKEESEMRAVTCQETSSTPSLGKCHNYSRLNLMTLC